MGVLGAWPNFGYAQVMSQNCSVCGRKAALYLRPKESSLCFCARSPLIIFLHVELSLWRGCSNRGLQRLLQKSCAGSRYNMEGLGPQLMDINCKLLTQQRVHAEGTAKQLPSKASYAPQAPSSSSRGLGKQVGLLSLGALFAVFGIFSQYFPEVFSCAFLCLCPHPHCTGYR